METEPAKATSLELKNIVFAVKLSFWLGRPYVLAELIDDLIHLLPFYPITLANALFCLIELGSWKIVKHKLKQISEDYPEKDLDSLEIFKAPLQIAILCHEQSLDAGAENLITQRPEKASRQIERTLLYMLELAIDTKNTALMHKLLKALRIGHLHLRV